MCASNKAVRNDYSTLITHEITDMVKSEKIEDAVDFMYLYRITPASLT